MSFRVEMLDYIDGNGLTAPALTSRSVPSASGNGVMYTSEKYVLLKLMGELTELDIANYDLLLSKCVDKDGVLHRVPVGTNFNDGQEGPDDYYAALNACIQLGITDVPRQFLKAAIVNLGALNNVNPGKWTFSSFLVRQPQLVCAMITAAFPSMRNPLHYLIRLLAFPLYFYSACVIELNSINLDPKEIETRRLGWHLVHSLKSKSLLCYLASLTWYERLHNDYGPNAMQTIAANYYERNHPFSKYFID